MLLKTSNYKQGVFISAVIISAGFSIYFFQAFGSSVLTRVIWALVALTVQAYQVICLREYHNSKFRKSKSNISLYKYAFITLFSIMASISFGLFDIQKTVYLNSEKVVSIDIIDQKIQLKNKMLSSDNSEIIRKQIEDLQKDKKENTEYWSHVNNRKINELRNSLINDPIKILTDIEVLKLQKAELIKETATTKGAFESLGSALLIGEHAVRLIFLLCLSIIIELMVYSTSSFTMPKKKAKKKKKSKDQLTFEGISK